MSSNFAHQLTITQDSHVNSAKSKWSCGCRVISYEIMVRRGAFFILGGWDYSIDGPKKNEISND